MKPNDVIKKMKELGCNSDVEIKKIEQIDGAMEVTFMDDCAKEKRKLPKSWEEFMTMFPMKVPYIFAIRPNTDLDPTQDYLIPYRNRLVEVMEEFTEDRATAEAVLALCQLIQLRNCYNGDWVPDWKNGRETKFMIIIYEGEIDVDCSNSLPSSFLYFKTKELRDEFLKYFRPLIEKLKPLYGIKGGGEE